jgi:hypothetical protein
MAVKRAALLEKRVRREKETQEKKQQQELEQEQRKEEARSVWTSRDLYLFHCYAWSEHYQQGRILTPTSNLVMHYCQWVTK